MNLQRLFDMLSAQPSVLTPFGVYFQLACGHYAIFLCCHQKSFLICSEYGRIGSTSAAAGSGISPALERQQCPGEPSIAHVLSPDLFFTPFQPERSGRTLRGTISVAHLIGPSKVSTYFQKRSPTLYGTIQGQK